MHGEFMKNWPNESISIGQANENVSIREASLRKVS